MNKLNDVLEKEIISLFPYVSKVEFDDHHIFDRKYKKHVISYKEVDNKILNNLRITTSMYKQYPKKLLNALKIVYNKFKIYLIKNNGSVELWKFNNDDEFINYIHDKVWDYDVDKEFIIIEEAKLIIFIGYEVSITLFFIEMNDKIEEIEQILILSGAHVTIR